MLEPQPKGLELDLAFLEYGFQRIQGKVKEEYLKGGKENSTKNLKKYADGDLKRTLALLEQKIETQLTAEFKRTSKTHTPKEIKAFAQEILRREHIKYLSSLYPEKGIIKEGFEINKKKYTSSQIPIGTFRNCYHRWGVGEDAGLSAFRSHTLSDKDGKELIKYYHHSSPVVYEEPDYKKCIEATDANLRQAVREADKETGGGPLTEIRLLSTSRGPGGDYKQAVATYLSAIRVSTHEAPITVFFHGLNPARFSLNKLLPFKIPGYSVGLETFINTRSTHELLEKTFKQLDIVNPHVVAIKEKRKTLDEKIKAIKLENKSEADVEKELCDLLREHYKSEKELLKTYKIMQKRPTGPLDERQQLIRSEANTILTLMQNNRYLKPKYNGQLQATLVRLNTRLGEHVATGCNDAKDRDGMVSIAVEANEIYRDRYGKYPDITAAGKEGSIIRQELRKIQDEVCALSTPASVAEFVSWPELAQGLDNTKAPLSGFGHLPNDGSMAGYFKKIHHDYYKSHSNNVKNIILPAYINKPPEPAAQKKWVDKESDLNQDLHATSNNIKNRDPGELQEIITLKDNDSKTEFTSIKPIEEDPDAKAPHRIEVYEREIRYQPDKMPSDEAVLKKIVEKVVEEAITKFKPTSANDLHFEGNAKMQQLAKMIATEKLGQTQSETFTTKKDTVLQIK